MKTTKPHHCLGVYCDDYAEIICGNQPYLITTASYGQDEQFQLGQTIHLEEYDDGFCRTFRWCAAEIGRVSRTDLPQPRPYVVIGLLNVKTECN